MKRTRTGIPVGIWDRQKIFAEVCFNDQNKNLDIRLFDQDNYTIDYYDFAGWDLSDIQDGIAVDETLLGNFLLYLFAYNGNWDIDRDIEQARAMLASRREGEWPDWDDLFEDLGIYNGADGHSYGESRRVEVPVDVLQFLFSLPGSGEDDEWISSVFDGVERPDEQEDVIDVCDILV